MSSSSLHPSQVALTQRCKINCVSLQNRQIFYESLFQQNLDALLLGGDIGEADSVPRFLSEMENALRLPIYFVLGNHDFYWGSIAMVPRLD